MVSERFKDALERIVEITSSPTAMSNWEKLIFVRTRVSVGEVPPDINVPRSHLSPVILAALQGVRKNIVGPEKPSLIIPVCSFESSDAIQRNICNCNFIADKSEVSVLQLLWLSRLKVRQTRIKQKFNFVLQKYNLIILIIKQQTNKRVALYIFI